MSIALRMTFQPYGALTPFTIEVNVAATDAIQVLNIGSQSSGAGAGKVTFNPFSFTKRPDVHSGDFWLRMCNGTPYQKVTLMATTNGAPAPYFTFAMGLAAVKTVGFAASESDGTLVEAITMEYGQSGYSVTPQNPDGSFGTPVGSGWDRVRNVAMDPSQVGLGIK